MTTNTQSNTMTVQLKIWRQKNATAKGRFETYRVSGITPDQSFLEMLDVLNNNLERDGLEPVAVESDCREGICGTCGCVANGRPHGPVEASTTCQLYMRAFRDGDTVTIEPWRAGSFPVIKDLIVDRSAFDRIIQAGGFISARAGQAPEANSIPVPKPDADTAMDAAQCIGCGACVAACKNASAMLFVAAKVSHLGHLPQGQPERKKRAQAMVAQMDAEGFGSCSNAGACEAACPKQISVAHIARLNRDYLGGLF